MSMLNFFFIVNVFSIFGRELCNGNYVLKEDGKIIIQTNTGLVQGEQGGFLRNSSQAWYQFRKIPYAEPPEGPRRFEVRQQTRYNFVSSSSNFLCFSLRRLS